MITLRKSEDRGNSNFGWLLYEIIIIKTNVKAHMVIWAKSICL